MHACIISILYASLCLTRLLITYLRSRVCMRHRREETLHALVPWISENTQLIQAERRGLPLSNGLESNPVNCCVSEPYCHSILFVCLSGCLSVIPAYHDGSITTKFGRQVYACPRTRVSLFGSPISHTFGARGKNMHNFAYFQRQPFKNAYSCHCERDVSCHMTCHTCDRILITTAVMQEGGVFSSGHPFATAKTIQLR